MTKLEIIDKKIDNLNWYIHLIKMHVNSHYGLISTTNLNDYLLTRNQKKKEILNYRKTKERILKLLKIQENEDENKEA